MAVRLSKRLTALAEMVTGGNRLADIGTDHGYIPIYLCMEGKIPSAIAMDINEGPLQRAGEHILEYGLSDRIETRLSDGLEKLLPKEAETILIAGMGGGLVKKILSEGGHALDGVKELILQPQSEVSQVRSYVRETGFCIVDEDMVEEDGKFYPMMKVHKVSEGKKESGGNADSDAVSDNGSHTVSDTESHTVSDTESNAGNDEIRYRKLCDAFGPVLLERRNPVLLRWLKRELGITQNIIKQLDKQSSNEQIEVRRRELTEKQKLLEDALKIFKEVVL